MKIALTIFTIILVLGCVYILALFGVIPAQSIADHNSSMRPMLISLGLAKKPKVHPKPVQKTETVAPDYDKIKKEIAAAQAKVDADRLRLEQDKALYEKEKLHAASVPDQPKNNEARKKVVSIYETMQPEDVAKILENVSDASIIKDLTMIDEKKAGKILAALSPKRAAKISEIMAAQRPVKSSSSPHPMTSLE